MGVLDGVTATMERHVVIDCFPESAARYLQDHALVVVDVIRATTTAVGAVALGRRCFPVPSLEAAWRLRSRLPNPLLVGELAGIKPRGFAINNSPAEVAMRKDIARPMVLLSSSGTRLMHAARDGLAVYLACFRNAASIAAYLAGRHDRIAVIGAGSRGEFRKEDQICCAWIAADLMRLGYRAADARTTAVVNRWAAAPATACAGGKSAAYLRESGQRRDLDFILGHVNDQEDVFRLEGPEVVMLPAETDEQAGGAAAAQAGGA